MFSRILYPPPASWLVNGMSLGNLLFLLAFGISEFTGIHLQYSKFSNSNDKKSVRTKHVVISSKNGMLLFYTPALLACIASFWLLPNVGHRILILKFAVALHFFKRNFEVLFVHKYSGGVTLDSAILISIVYFSEASMLLYAQSFTLELPEPPVDLKLPGLIMFLLGISGNFYHHHLLASLRKKGEKGYKIPKGGLFGLVICPHYLFEITGFIGFALISQTLCAVALSTGVACYLAGRSYSTRKWYVSKFENFPKHVKALVPFVY